MTFLEHSFRPEKHIDFGDDIESRLWFLVCVRIWFKTIQSGSPGLRTVHCTVGLGGCVNAIQFFFRLTMIMYTLQLLSAKNWRWLRLHNPHCDEKLTPFQFSNGRPAGSLCS